MAIVNIPDIDDISMNGVQAFFDALVHEVETRPKVAPITLVDDRTRWNVLDTRKVGVSDSRLPPIL
jgi:hypothetical protein